MSLTVKYLQGGYCRQLLATVDGRSLKLTRFYAVFLALLHPSLGWVICDTGYGNRFFAASRRWPYRLYRFATPVTLRGTVASALAELGVRPAEVKHVIITHFHADHIGGLAELSQAQVYYREDALDPLFRLSPFKQTRAAFLPELVPNDLAARSVRIPVNAFHVDPVLDLPVHDVFGDGSIKLVYLPGHAPGQVGLEFTADGVTTLYCADAFWRALQIEKGVNLPRLTQSIQWDPTAYQATIEKLRQIAARGTHRLRACHE